MPTVKKFLLLGLLVALSEVPLAIAADQANDAKPSATGQLESPAKNTPTQRTTDQEALAIAALRGLLSAPPERAYPLIERTLNGAQTERVKVRALFVLSQIDWPAARQLLLKFTEAQPTGTRKIRLEAIRMVGVNGDSTTIEALRATYANGDIEIKEAVIQAYQIAEAKSALLSIASTERNAKLSERAINALAAMGANAELLKLKSSGVDPQRLVQAYGISADLEALRELATNARDPETQARAARSIGIVGGNEALKALHQIYLQAANPQVKRGALEGMLIADDAQGMMKLYRASTNASDKRQLLEKLTLLGGDAALDAIDAALEGKSP